MITGYDIATDILDYGELLVYSVGTILEIRRASDIRYLSAYLKLLDAEYKGEQYSFLQWKIECEGLAMNMTFGGNPQEM